MVDFRNLARQFGALVEREKQLMIAHKALGEQQVAMMQSLQGLIGYWNAFYGRGFFGRLKWLLGGK